MKILVIDNFDSFTFNLVDYFKQLKCEVVVYRNTVDPAKIDAEAPDLIVFSPGPSVPKNAGNMMKIIDLYHKKYPMFGVCLGHQALIEYFGGELKFVEPVHGKSSAISHDGQTIFKDIPNRFMAGRYHSLAAKRVPDCFTVSACLPPACRLPAGKAGQGRDRQALHDDIVMAIRHKELPIEGVQFHPESVLTMKGEFGMKLIENVLKSLIAQNQSSIIRFFEDSISGKLSVEEQEKFLLEKNDLSAEELAEVVGYLQKKVSMKVELPNAIDLCGTGGSGLKRINTSTVAAFVLSSLDIGVAKHGNRASSGRCGSFDLLEALGIGLQDNADDIERKYKKINLAFLFAPIFHPVMQHFAKVRKKIGRPTFFNILGPLLNPADTKRQVIGTSFKDKMELIAETCRLLGKERVVVVCGEDGLDEVTLTGTTYVVELRDGKIKKYSVTPEDFGTTPSTFHEIEGGSVKDNKDIAERLLNGICNDRHLSLVLINCAMALRVAGVEENLKTAYAMAKSAYEDGSVQRTYKRAKLYTNCPSILLEIIEKKRREVDERKARMPLDTLKRSVTKSTRNFAEAIKLPGLSIIAEIKKTSPSTGLLRTTEVFSPVDIAQQYEAAGVSAISVLTDKKYFGGRLEFLTQVRAATDHTPLLCKDFIIDEYQIYEARSYGADAILLISAVLTKDQIERFHKIAHNLDMDVLCEVHTEEEVPRALSAGGEIIGINNRNLHTFEVDLNTTRLLASLIPRGRVIVSESGFNTREDIEKLPSYVNAILVGSTLMKSENISEKLKSLIPSLHVDSNA